MLRIKCNGTRLKAIRHLRYGELTLVFNAAEAAELCSRAGELRKEL